MQIDEPFRYDADPGTVVAMLLDPEFQKAKCAASGAISYEVDVAGRDITVRRTMPTEGIPDIVKKLVGQTVVITERTTWGEPAADGSITSSLNLEFSGQPMKMAGRVILNPAGAVTAGQLRGELKAGVPLIGGKIEKATAPQIVAGLRSEVETGQTYLAGL